MSSTVPNEKPHSAGPSGVPHHAQSPVLGAVESSPKSSIDQDEQNPMVDLFGLFTDDNWEEHSTWYPAGYTPLHFASQDLRPITEEFLKRRPELSIQGEAELSLYLDLTQGKILPTAEGFTDFRTKNANLESNRRRRSASALLPSPFGPFHKASVPNTMANSARFDLSHHCYDYPLEVYFGDPCPMVDCADFEANKKRLLDFYAPVPSNDDGLFTQDVNGKVRSTGVDGSKRKFHDDSDGDSDYESDDEYIPTRAKANPQQRKKRKLDDESENDSEIDSDKDSGNDSDSDSENEDDGAASSSVDVSPAPAAPVAPIVPVVSVVPVPPRRNRGSWQEDEAQAINSIIRALQAARPGLRDVPLFRRVSYELHRQYGFNRTSTACKNYWNRHGRALFKWDERTDGRSGNFSSTSVQIRRI